MGLDKGYVQVYTGDGKGKTSAALGLAFRALGRDMRVLMVQFLKSQDSTGEHFSAKAFPDQLTIKPFGLPGFVFQRGIQPEDRALAFEALETAGKAMINDGYDLVILDEINVAVDVGLIDIDDLLTFIETKPDKVELVLTGRNAHEKLIDRADLVSVIKAEKHYFSDGVKARKGIEN